MTKENKEHILFHLNEASEEVTRTIREIKDDPDYDEAEFFVAMQHLYHHVNTAWNSRSIDPERIYQYSQEDFDLWRQFPTDIEM